MTAKTALMDRLAKVAKGAPLQEATGEEIPAKASTHNVGDEPKTKAKVGRKPKNLQIPQDLWEAYEHLKNNNTTSLLMTPYILGSIQRKLARDGAFNK
jgi:hypothetical protein